MTTATLDRPTAAAVPFTEPMGVMTAPDESQGADAQSTKSPATVESVEGVGTVAWTNPSNAKASDDTRATAALTIGTTSRYLKATNFGFALPEGATVVGIIAEVERSCEPEAGTPVVRDERVRIVKGGAIKEAEDKASPDIWPLTTDAYKVYGNSQDLWGQTWLYSDINSSGFGLAIAAKNPAAPKTQTARVDHVRISVYYTEEADPNRICFAGRSIELRSDGVFRQDADDDVWGRIVPEGFLPHAAPSGLEERPTRGILIPTRGDLGELADAESNKLSAVVKTRAGFHFSREAEPPPPTYEETVLATEGLVSLWPLGEASGNAIDAKGSNDGEPEGSLVRAEASILPNGEGKSCGFGGGFDIPHDASLDVGDSFTLEAWVKPSALGADRNIFTGPTGAMRWYARADGSLRLDKRGGVALVDSSSKLSTETAYHLAAVKSGVTRKIYVNGVDVSTGGTGQTVESPEGAYAISDPEQPWDGWLQFVALYDVGLDAETIKAHYEAGL